MKIAQRLVAAAALGLAASFGAQATVITSEYNPSPDVWVTPFNSPYTFTHDLRGHGLPGATVNSASLAVYLYDISDPLGIVPETINFSFNHLDTAVVKNVSFFGKEYAFGLNTALLQTGVLEVSLSAGCSKQVWGVCVLPQDVMFARSVLTADITLPVVNEPDDEEPAEVPEPSTLLALGIGLLGLVAARRRKSVGVR